MISTLKADATESRPPGIGPEASWPAAGSLRGIIQAVWEKFVQPSVTLIDPEERRRAQMVAGALVVTIGVGLLAAAITGLRVARGESPAAELWLVGISLLPLALAYGLSRSQHQNAAGVVTIATLMVSTLAAANLGADKTFAFAYVVLPGLVAGLLFSARTTLRVFVVGLAGLLASHIFNPDVEGSDVINALFLFIACAVLMTVMARMREANAKTLQAHAQALAQSKAELEGALGDAVRTNRKKEELVRMLEGQTKQRALLAELGNLLQGCSTVDDLVSLLQTVVAELFHEHLGYVYMFRAPRDSLQLIGHWGGQSVGQAEYSIPHMDCMAMRLGRRYGHQLQSRGPSCAHIPADNPGSTLCVPMIGNGEVLGLLHVRRRDGQPAQQEETNPAFGTGWEDLAGDVAGLLGMAISNLQLRERLRSEAISDSLTGLFNRRYLDATIDREIDRADRAHRSIGIIMLDIDDFKRLNDTHGHHVGDEVLRLVGGLLDRQTRAGDIVCRYGGEEFVLVLPEASLADTQARAESLLAAIRQLRHDVGDGNTASITMSGGVVALPEHGSDAATLMRLADQALYLAKAEGKDRLVTATIPGR